MHIARLARTVAGTLLLAAVAAGPGRAQSAPSTFVFSNDNNHGFPNTISAFKLSESGRLTEVVSSVETGGVGFGSVYTSSNLIATNAKGSRLFVVNGGDGTVSVFKVNRTTGRPKLLRPNPFALVPKPLSTQSIAATLDGRFVFVSDADLIHALSVSTEGDITEVPGSPFATPELGFVIRMQVSSDGRFLAAAMDGNQKVAVYRIDDDGGLISPSGGTDPGDPTAGTGISVAFSCAGNRLFSVQAGSVRGPIVNVYNVAADGSLVAVAGSPFAPGPVANPVYATTSTDGDLLFVGFTGFGIASYRIADDGGLSMVAGSPFPIGSDGSTTYGPATFMPDSTGRFLFAASVLQGGIYSARVKKDGSLVALRGSPLRTSSSTSIVVTPPAVCDARASSRRE